MQTGAKSAQPSMHIFLVCLLWAFAGSAILAAVVIVFGNWR